MSTPTRPSSKLGKAASCGSTGTTPASNRLSIITMERQRSPAARVTTTSSHPECRHPPLDMDTLDTPGPSVTLSWASTAAIKAAHPDVAQPFLSLLHSSCPTFLPNSKSLDIIHTLLPLHLVPLFASVLHPTQYSLQEQPKGTPLLSLDDPATPTIQLAYIKTASELILL